MNEVPAKAGRTPSPPAKELNHVFSFKLPAVAPSSETDVYKKVNRHKEEPKPGKIFRKMLYKELSRMGNPVI